MSAPEFVALSEERIEVILSRHLGIDPVDRESAIRRLASTIASEASENTKRWLMEMVCSECGRGDDPERLVHLETEGWATCACRGYALVRTSTRAEYLSRTEPR